jgi:predicted transcriptional regulator
MTTPRRRWVLSLRAVYWQQIVDGSKRFELRRRLPGVQPGDQIVVYVTRPTRRVVGSFVVGAVLRDTPGRLWPMVRDGVPDDHAALFPVYFEGAQEAAAMAVTEVRVLHNPLAPWFHAPQGVILLPEKP